MMEAATDTGIFALALLETKLMSCDQGYSDFTGWDFEDGSMGSWTLISENPNYKWNIIKASNSAHKIGMPHDHSTMTPWGHIAEVTSKDQGTKAPTGSKTLFRSPKVTNPNEKSLVYCLSFWIWKRPGDDSLEIIQEIHGQNGQNGSTVNKNIIL